MIENRMANWSHAENEKSSTVAGPPPSGRTEYRKLEGSTQKRSVAVGVPDKTTRPVSQEKLSKKTTARQMVLEIAPRLAAKKVVAPDRMLVALMFEVGGVPQARPFDRMVRLRVHVRPSPASNAMKPRPNASKK